MSTELISGKEMAVSIREEIKERVTGLKEDGLTPGLAVPNALFRSLTAFVGRRLRVWSQSAGPKFVNPR